MTDEFVDSDDFDEFNDFDDFNEFGYSDDFDRFNDNSSEKYHRFRQKKTFLF